MSAPYTSEEVQIARMARQYKGEIVAVGSTPMANIATKVAKMVHNDDIVVLGGNSWACFDSTAAPVFEGELGGRKTARGQFDWSLVFDLIRKDKFRIFVGPVQIDRSGAANISVVGDWEQPKVQLIGSRGLPDDLWSLSELHFHVPNQTKRNLVESVDFVSSFGNGAVRQTTGCTTGRPGVLVTNLATYIWPDGGDIAVESIHPEVTADDVRAATGFDIDIPEGTPTTDPPSTEELDAIRYLSKNHVTPPAASELLSRLDPEIALIVRDLPPVDLRDVGAARAAMDARATIGVAPAHDRPDVTKRDLEIPGTDGVPVALRTYRPVGTDSVLPCLFWIHGGGYVMGSLKHDDLLVQEMVHFAGCAAVAVEWRHAPEHPFPASLTDCHDGLQWVWQHTADLGVDPARIALGGASSGGGTAAALALLVRDRGEMQLCYQLLIYPMLDDRNETPSSYDVVDRRVWHRDANELAWRYYLGDQTGDSPGGGELARYAVPARMEDLAGLPPTFISVGALDLFVDEDIDYACRLLRAHVPTELHVYPGTPHGVNKLGYQAEVARQFAADRDNALRRALRR